MSWWHALSRRLISVLLICATTLIGDNLVFINKHRLVKALCDNLTHGMIGALTWVTVSYFVNSLRRQGGNIALCTFLSMVIDLDHFVAARSFLIKDATSLTHRPILHCSTIPVVSFLVGCVGARLARSSATLRYTCIFGGAFFSHHLRDAARRGLWFWPFGSTPPLNPFLYFSSIALLPHVLGFILSEVGERDVPFVETPILSV